MSEQSDKAEPLRERLAANHLAEIAALYLDYPRALAKTIELIEVCERVATKEALADLAQARLDAEAKAITQCAIEAGERSPEGVSSHTMLGDMWDERIRAAEKRAELERAAGEGKNDLRNKT